MLNRKNITRLLDRKNRQAVISKVSPEKRRRLKSAEYARYVVDGQILHRDETLENDRKSSYGFSPINFLCAVAGDGTIKNRLFEFNTVNHFLHLKEGENACEVVEAILLMWKDEDRSISNFDPDVIDLYLVDVEKSCVENQEDCDNA
jgi:hypothetical protein